MYMFINIHCAVFLKPISSCFLLSKYISSSASPTTMFVYCMLASFCGGFVCLFPCSAPPCFFLLLLSLLILKQE